MESQPQNPEFKINPENFHPLAKSSGYRSTGILANSEDPDEKPHYSAAFHKGLHGLLR